VGKAADQTGLTRLLDRLESDNGGVKQAAASAIGITPSRYSKVYGGKDLYSLSVENCLRLARLTRESPGTVLRICGKDEIAAVLDDLYTPALASDGQFALAVGGENLRAILTALTKLPDEELAPLVAANELVGRLYEGRRKTAQGSSVESGPRLAAGNRRGARRRPRP